MAIRRPRRGPILAVSLLVVAAVTAATATPAAATTATGQTNLAGTATAIPDGGHVEQNPAVSLLATPSNAT